MNREIHDVYFRERSRVVQRNKRFPQGSRMHSLVSRLEYVCFQKFSPHSASSDLELMWGCLVLGALASGAASALRHPVRMLGISTQL